MASLIGWNSVVDWSARLGRLNNSSLINFNRFGPSFDAVFKNLFTFDLWSLGRIGQEFISRIPFFYKDSPELCYRFECKIADKINDIR